MLKAALYLGLTAVAIVGTFFNPLIGGVGSLEAYLMNPTVLNVRDGGFHYQLWMTLAFMLSCLIHRTRGLPSVGHEGAVLKALWLFVAIGCASSLWAVVNPQLALDTIYEMFKTVLLVTFLVRVIRNEDDMSVIVLACVFGALHASFMHVLGPRLGYIPHSMGRDKGVLPDDYQAVILVLFVPLLILLATMGNWKEKILSWVALPFALDSIVNSYMRTAFVALAVQLVAIVLFLPRRITLRLLPVLAVGIGLFFFRFTPDTYWEWMDTIKTPTDEASANSRFTANRTSLQIFLDHPMGVGYRNYIEISPQYFATEMLDPTTGKRAAHNCFFTILCETGVFGFSVWIFGIGRAVWLLRRIRKSSNPNSLTRVEIFAMGLEIGMYGWLVSGWFHSTHELDPAYWFAGFAVVLTRLSGQPRLISVAKPDDEDKAIDDRDTIDEVDASSDMAPGFERAR